MKSRCCSIVLFRSTVSSSSPGWGVSPIEFISGCLRSGGDDLIFRDFTVEGDAVNLIDIKAGIEHFGRKIPDRMDIILGVLDYTLESVSIAKRMAEFCQEAGINNFWLILNKIGSEEVESMLMDKLANLRDKVIGSISYDQELIKAGLSGSPG